MRPTKIQREALDRQEAVWLAAVESGEHTTTTLAAMLGLSPSWVRERVARARQSREASSGSNSEADIPRLALVSNPMFECSHTATSIGSDGAWYCLRCDKTSLDEGRSWTVRVANGTGRGDRVHRLQTRSSRPPPEPPGPTSYRPSEGLKGGKGRSRRAGSTDRTSRGANRS